ncbi:hypothetical protein G9A89_011796 [Geosiphon pyriformis]|nr:hypothetical protein G9A89_011796 [Geosiphon pyriformis]
MPYENLPYAAEAEAPLSTEELNVLRRQHDREAPEVTTQTKFNFAWGLIRSRRKTDHQLGVGLLTEIYKETPDRRRECLYYLALGYYKLSEYSKAREYNSQLLAHEPNNLQALSLKQLIEDGVSSEGKTGFLIVGGVVALGAILYTTYVSAKKSG